MSERLVASDAAPWCPVCFEAPEPEGRWTYPGDRFADLHHEHLEARRAGEFPSPDDDLARLALAWTSQALRYKSAWLSARRRALTRPTDGEVQSP